ncbi:MAG: hypothetical protein DRR42_16675 [Gammaproteobacteria bacterium]|nr:MAG: hypothetical protein DRR42_16675 [Gammaproteobacteria bacterium]
MSGIFGIFQRDGKNVSAIMLNEVHLAMSYWKPDDSGIWLSGEVGLGQLLSWNTPESRFEALPRVQENVIGDLVIIADVRLDNREEIFEQLSRQSALIRRPLKKITDSELLLAAYREWGRGSPEKLLGDFAYVIWDGTRKELFCVRDHIGIKPLYYYLDDNRMVFANDMRGLAGRAEVPTTLDAQSIGSYLRDSQLLDEERTFVQGVLKLPPASTLTLNADGVICETYWRPENSPPVRLGSLEDYSTRLRELLDKSIKARLRTAYPVAGHLSGGLDSSVIAVLASRQLRDQGLPFYSYNWTQKLNEDSTCYEWANSLCIAEQESMHHEYISLNSDDIANQLNSIDLATHTAVVNWYENPLRSIVRNNNVRVILSGWGGDELITYSGRRRFTGEFWHGNITKALRGLMHEARHSSNSTRRFAGACYHEILMPVVGRFLDFVSNLVGRDQRQLNQDYLACARKRIVESAQIHGSNLYHGWALSCYEEQLALFKQGHIQNRVESWTNAGRPDLIEYRYPLLDKRLVEFAFGLPAECYRQEGKKRYLFRLSAKGLVPEKLRWGNYKREPQRVERLLKLFMAAFKDQFNEGALSSASETNKEAHEFIDSEEVAKLIKSLEQDDDIDHSHRSIEIMTVMKSLLVLSAGRSFPNDRNY